MTPLKPTMVPSITFRSSDSDKLVSLSLNALPSVTLTLALTVNSTLLLRPSKIQQTSKSPNILRKTRKPLKVTARLHLCLLKKKMASRLVVMKKTTIKNQKKS